LRKQRLRKLLPWTAWGVALVLIGVLSDGMFTTQVLPAEALADVVQPAAPRTSLVERVLIEPGQRVKAGDLLVQLDASDLELELSVQRLELEKLVLQVPAEKSVLARETSESLAQRQRLKDELSLEVARLQATLVQDKAELAQLSEQVDAQRKLVDQQLARSTTLDELQLRLSTLSKKVSEGERLTAQAQSNLRSAHARLKDVQQGGEGTITAPLEAQARAQRERIAQLEMSIERLAVRAPRDGVVGVVTLQPGDTAQQGMALVQLHAVMPRRLVAYADEHEAARVKVGDKAAVTSRVAGQPLRTAKVVALGAAFEDMPVRFRRVPTEPEYARKVFLLLDDGQPGVLAGQTFDVQLSADTVTTQAAGPSAPTPSTTATSVVDVMAPKAAARRADAKAKEAAVAARKTDEEPTL